MIVEYETSLQDGRPVYEFDVFESDVGIEVEYEIDAETGLFLESEIELFEIGNPWAVSNIGFSHLNMYNQGVVGRKDEIYDI